MCNSLPLNSSGVGCVDVGLESFDVGLGVFLGFIFVVPRQWKKVFWIENAVFIQFVASDKRCHDVIR